MDIRPGSVVVVFASCEVDSVIELYLGVVASWITAKKHGKLGTRRDLGGRVGLVVDDIHVGWKGGSTGSWPRGCGLREGLLGEAV